MVVAFTITEINYLLVNLFFDVVLPLFYLYWPAIYIYIYICGITFFVVVMVTPPHFWNGGAARTAIQVHAVHLIEIRLGERW